MATRAQATAAMEHISEQGEGAPTVVDASHYQRFLAIYQHFDRIKKQKGINWRPTHRVVENPHTNPSGKPRSLIKWPRSKKWAKLFDLRYHMLLTYLGHTFTLASNGSHAQLRGAVIHRVFAEMYNLKAIAGILVQLPLQRPDDRPRAGPPFSPLPASRKLPTKAIKRWELHGKLIQQALDLNATLSSGAGIADKELAYLQTLRELDKEAAKWVGQVIVGLNRGPAA